MWKTRGLRIQLPDHDVIGAIHGKEVDLVSEPLPSLYVEAALEDKDLRPRSSDS